MKRDRVASIVVENGNILLMYRINNKKEYYTFPGGGIESGETHIEALEREIMEETSIKIKVVKLLYEVDWDHQSKQFFYLCEYIDGKPMLQENSVEKTAMADGTQFYNPCWIKTDLISQTLLYPLEVRDFFIEDINNGLFSSRQPIYLEIKNCRQNI